MSVYVPTIGTLVRIDNYKEDRKTRFIRVVRTRNTKVAPLSYRTRYNGPPIARGTILVTGQDEYSGEYRSFYIAYCEHIRPALPSEVDVLPRS